MLDARFGVSVAAGSLMSWFGQKWIFIILTLFAILLDYLTGLLSGRANEGINSSQAIRGLYKKIGILCLLVLGLFLDASVNYFIRDGLNYFELLVHLPIAHIVTLWIIVTEAISICENLERLGVHIPAWMIKMLRKTQKSLNERREDKE